MTDPADGGDSASDDGERRSRLGQFIRTQRHLAQLSQRELAKLTDLSDPYVSQLERGLHEPSMRVLRALGRALNVRAETMLGYAGWIEQATGTPSDTEAAIRGDEQLTETQKHALLEVYRSFVAQQSGAEADGKT